MKFISIALLSLMSITSFAGQHGSGGNICIAHDGIKYQAFDEVKHWNLASNQFSIGATIHLGPAVITNQGFSKLFEGDLINTTTAIMAQEKLMAISATDPFLSQLLLRNLSLVRDVHVQDRPFTIYAEVGSGSNKYCKENTLKAVILTRPTGTILVSSYLWNRLSAETQVVIYIHEVLRIAQLFSPWFNVSNDELEKLTMLIYSGNYEEFTNHSFYQSFRKWNDRMLALSQNDLKTFLDMKPRLVSRALYRFQADEAFILSLKAMDYEYYLGLMTGMPKKNEIKAMTAMKSSSQYVGLIVEDLLNQFGSVGP